MKKWKLQVTELQSKLDAVTVDFGKTVADLKMTEEVIKVPPPSTLSLNPISMCTVFLGGHQCEESVPIHC